MLQMMISTTTALLLLLLVQVASAEANQHTAEYQQQMDELWTNFKKTYNKVYGEAEDTYRRKAWAANVEYIQIHNIEADLGRHSYTLGVNEYSDLTMEEYKKFLLGSRSPRNNSSSSNDIHYFKYSVNDLPDTVDWRTKGYVTPVKNQGQCGSCWAFSSTGSLEGQNFKKTGQLVSLSEQNLVDCTKSYGNQGCNGGWMANSFKYVMQNRGIDTEACYPYEGRDGSPCRFKTSCVGAKCSGSKSIAPAGDESALMAAVANVGPISVAIDANHPSFFSYKGGVYDEPKCTSSIDHAVLVVGYGTYQGQDYWLVKNSWGTSWGLNGYVMMSRNKNNQCAIASYAIYPVV